MADFNTPRELRNRDTDRRREYDANLAFYRGDQWGTPTPTTRNISQRRRLVHNYARAIVTKSAAYTIDDTQLVVDPVGPSDEEHARAASAELALAQVAEQNALDIIEFDNELQCSVLGDAAYKVTWSPEENRVRVSAPHPGALSVWRRAGDYATVDRVAQSMRLNAADAASVYGALADAGNGVTYIEDWTPDVYRLWVRDLLKHEEPNAYGFIPFTVYPNIREPGREWGTSDIAAIREPARELNRVMTQLSLIAELSGQPIAVLENVTADTDIAIQPGAVWDLPKDAKAYVLDLLQSGGVRLLLDYAAELQRIMQDLGDSPPAAFGSNARGLSGVALNVELDPIVKKVRRKRLVRGRALAERSAMVLAILRDFAGLDPLVAAQPARAQWGDVLPNDEQRDIANAVAKVNAALGSRRSAMAALGVADPDAELARWLDEAGQVAATQPTQAPTPAKPANPV